MTLQQDGMHLPPFFATAAAEEKEKEEEA